MTTITIIQGTCQADPLCNHALCFQARLDGHIGTQPVTGSVRLCAVHLGDTVQVLANWARENGVTCGRVTVLVIDTLQSGAATASMPFLNEPAPGGLEFGS